MVPAYGDNFEDLGYYLWLHIIQIDYIESATQSCTGWGTWSARLHIELDMVISLIDKSTFPKSPNQIITIL